jgi:hypothetical protein
LFGATDCINGTVLPKAVLGTVPTNYTVLIDVHQKYGPENKLDPVIDKKIINSISNFSSF